MPSHPAPNHPIRVGVAGLGRSGWGIHCAAFDHLNDLFQVVAVTDPNPGRCQEAATRFGCNVHEDFGSLASDPQVELVVVSTPNTLHGSHTVKALEAGKAVVCEKPMAISLKEAQHVVATAEQTGQLLAPFQNLRYAPDFLKVQEIIASGKLGRIVQIRVAAQGFYRRWDWQTLREFGGGELNNFGPHIIDQLLQFIGPNDPEVFCHMDCALTSGDAEDHVNVMLRAANAPLIQLELTSACAYPQNRWLIMGTSGSLTGSPSELSWKYVDFSKMPDRPVEREPTPQRNYNQETLDFIEETWKNTDAGNNKMTHHHFYRGLYSTLREGQPLRVTPESVRRQIEIIERCHAQHNRMRVNS